MDSVRGYSNGPVYQDTAVILHRELEILPGPYAEQLPYSGLKS
jgi:hypothetical protein